MERPAEVNQELIKPLLRLMQPFLGLNSSWKCGSCPRQEELEDGDVYREHLPPRDKVLMSSGGGRAI